MKNLFKKHRHQFKKVGYVENGVCLEKYVQCKKCAMVIIIINIHPKHRGLFNEFPSPRYYERKQLVPRRSEIRKRNLHILKLLKF